LQRLIIGNYSLYSQRHPVAVESTISA